MVGAFPPVITENDDKFEEFDEDNILTAYIKYTVQLEARIRELEAQLETLSPGVTRG